MKRPQYPTKPLLKLNFPNKGPDELQHTCALDLADGGPRALADVGAVLGITGEMTRLIESQAMRKIRWTEIELEDPDGTDRDEPFDFSQFVRNAAKRK